MPPAGSAATARTLRFSAQDLERFAAASGDRNPLHLDPVFARQTAFGTCVAQGALVGIGMLGLLPDEELAAVRSLRLWFTGAIFPGAESQVLANPSVGEAGAWELRLTARGKLLARAIARAEVPTLKRPSVRGFDRRPMRSATAEPDAPPASGDAVLGAYSSGPELHELARRWGATALDSRLLEALAWASYVVGMEIPGRDGLFTALTLSTGEAGGPAAGYRIEVRDYDERTGQVTLDGMLWDNNGRTAAAAMIEAFVLPAAPPLDAAALGLTGAPPSTPRGRVAVVGASRGFGAATAIALLARGFDVLGIYASSEEHAAGLVKLAGGRAMDLHMHRADARDATALAALAEQPLRGLVLSAATPPLAMGIAPKELAKYVADSLELAIVPLSLLLPKMEPGGWILFVSSSALSAPPRDWPHYVTAKAALEGLASWVAATSPHLKTIVLRPPTMRTALANTPSGRISAVAPERVAANVADRIVAGDLPTGLTLLVAEDVA